MRAAVDVCGCFPTGRHYPGIADRISRAVTRVEGLSALVPASAPWLAQKIAVIDFETTGLSAETDRALEVGVVCFEGRELVSLDNWVVNPGIPVPPEARAVHQISDAELAQAPPFSAIVPALRERLAGHLPVAYNAPFDQAFLRAELARAGVGAERDCPAFDPEVVWIDPLVWSRELFRDDGRSHKLSEVCARLGVEHGRAHRAAADAEATGRVLLALADRLPRAYGELVRLQIQSAARQEIDFSARRRPPASP